MVEVRTKNIHFIFNYMNNKNYANDTFELITNHIAIPTDIEELLMQKLKKLDKAQKGEEYKKSIEQYLDKLHEDRIGYVFGEIENVLENTS